MSVTDSTALVALFRAIREHSGMTLEQIREAGEHGADAGWPGFTWTADGYEFSEANKTTIWTLLAEEAEEAGCYSVPEYVASFKRHDMANDWDSFGCLLAWWALERVGQWLLDRAEPRKGATC